MAGLLIAGAATIPAIVDGSPTMFIGVAGFVVWVAFVIRTSVALLRQGDACGPRSRFGARCEPGPGVLWTLKER